MPPSSNPIAATAPLEEVELCLEMGDYYGLRSRLTMGQVLRSFLDAQTLIPTELLYGARATKILQGQGGLVETALGRVATAQARLPGQDSRARRAAMQKALAEIQGRVAKADTTAVRLAKTNPAFPALLAAGARPGASAEQDAVLMAALCRDLGEARSWSRKLGLVLDLIRGDTGKVADTMLDGVMADLVSVPSVISDLLGQQLTLGGSLRRTLDLALTELPRSLDPVPSPLIQINTLLLAGRLPVTRAALVERVRRLLRTSQPLGTGRRDEEIRSFHEILVPLATPTGVVGEAGMAEALVARYMRRLDQGGALGTRLAVEGILATLPRLSSRWQFLAALAGSETGVRHMNDLIAQVGAVSAADDLIDAMVMKNREPEQLREAMTGAVAAFERSGLPRDAKDRVAVAIRGTFDGYVLRGRLFETLARTEPKSSRRIHTVYDLLGLGLHSDETTRSRLLEYINHVMDPSPPEPEAPPPRAVPAAPAAASRTITVPPPSRRRGELGLQEMSPTITIPRAAAPAPSGGGGSRPNAPPTMLGTVPTQMGDIAGAATEMGPLMGATQLMTRMDMPASAGAGSWSSTSIPTVGQMRCPNCFAAKQGVLVCPACSYDESAPPRSGVQLLPGALLAGRYMVGRVLGQGGFGITYLGWDTRLQVQVAVKEYLPVSLVTRTPGTRPVVPHSPEHDLAFREGMSRFMEEARILARLRQVPEIVEVHDFFEEHGIAYMVMELLEGRTLQRCLQDEGGTLDYRRALSLLLPVIKAVHSVHEQGLIHRDLSPDNIFLTLKGAKLLDFGAARQAVGETTGNLTVILKRGYAPPEQYSAETRQGPWTDVYAMCATFYCAVTGRPPPAATSRWEDDPLQRPSQLGIAIPEAVEDVLVNGLTLRWQDRPRDMKVLLQAFTRALT